MIPSAPRASLPARLFRSAAAVEHGGELITDASRPVTAATRPAGGAGA